MSADVYPVRSAFGGGIFLPFCNQDKHGNDMQNELNETEISTEEDFGSKTDALVKIGLMTIGTQIATEVIHRAARYPLVVFGLGVAAGAYAYKERKKIIRTARQIQHQGKSLLPFKSGGK